MNGDSVIKCLGSAIKAEGSLRKWAKRHGLSPAFVSDVMLGRRKPSEKILTPLGIVREDREPFYRRKNGDART